MIETGEVMGTTMLRRKAEGGVHGNPLKGGGEEVVKVVVVREMSDVGDEDDVKLHRTIMQSENKWNNSKVQKNPLFCIFSFTFTTLMHLCIGAIVT